MKTSNVRSIRQEFPINSAYYITHFKQGRQVRRELVSPGRTNSMASCQNLQISFFFFIGRKFEGEETAGYKIRELSFSPRHSIRLDVHWRNLEISSGRRADPLVLRIARLSFSSICIFSWLLLEVRGVRLPEWLRKVGSNL